MDKQGFVVGVFDHQMPAARAVGSLWAASFARDQIDMVTRSQGPPETTGFTGQNDGAAGAGAIRPMPGARTVMGGGLLADVLAGVAFRAAGGTFLGPFVALGVNEAEARHYAREVDEGRVVVLVLAFERGGEASAILARHGAREGAITTGWDYRAEYEQQ